MNRQTGTLTVTGAAGAVHVYFEGGQVALCSARAVDEVPFLLASLVRKGVVPQDREAELADRIRHARQPVRDVVLASGLLTEQELDEIVTWCIEEVVCPLFELEAADFTFTDGDPLPELLGNDVLEMGQVRVSTAALVMEATRRKDEWKQIRNVIPDSDVLYVVDNDGRANLRELATDPEMMKVLRYLDGRHSLDAIAEVLGATRFDIHAIAAQLVMAQVARARSAEDVVGDALAMKAAGELTKAKELLDNALRQSRAPEVLRPLAEVCAANGQAARAVELYLELIQVAQDAGDLESALTDLDHVLALSPEDPELHFERAQIRAEMGRVDDAASGYVAAAQAFLGTRDIDRAIDACHRAKNLLPRSPDPHRYLAKAYLLDGQTDNATVEYKALWHALLTNHRPAKALEELKAALEADCKFAAVKDQVLSHAQNSEAVKTNRAMRTLAYVVTSVVVAGAGVAGFLYYQQVVVKDQGRGGIEEIKARLAKHQDALEHPRLQEEIARLRSRFGSDTDLSMDLDRLASLVRRDFDQRAEGQLRTGRSLLDGGRFDEAEAAFTVLRDRFPGTKSATGAAALIEQVRQARITAAVQQDTTEAGRRWQAWDWDGALQILEQVLTRRDLPGPLRTELTQQAVAWSAANRTARDLGTRAQAIEGQGDLGLALGAWRRAAAGEGEQAATAAREQARRVELRLAENFGKQVQDKAALGDATAFTHLDELTRLAQNAANDAVRTHLARLDIPFLLDLDSPLVTVTLRRQGRPDQSIRAPAGTTGPWQHRMTYTPTETLQVAVQRTGFSTEVLKISADQRRCSRAVVLARGPRWRSDLPGPAVQPPVLAGKIALVPTGHATLELADPATGTLRSVVFPDTVGEFRAPPVVWGARAYLVVEDGITAVDINARARLWSWDADGLRLGGPLWVQDHELIQGQLLVIAGLARGGMLPLGIDAEGRVTPYPVVELDGEITGTPIALPMSGRTVVYVPAGNQLIAFDISATTETSPPQRLFGIRTRGDLVGRPVPTTILGRPALLVADTTGLVVALDPGLDTPEVRRVIGSWAIEGTQPSTPVLDGAQAFVSVSEGRLYGLDLTRPGVVTWRFPAKGSLGDQPGQPAIGRRGIYATGANGVLSCVDRQTGRERWHADLGGSAVGGVVARDGLILIALRSGQLLAFDEGDD